MGGLEPWVVVVIIGILCVLFSWTRKEPEPSNPVTADIENAMDLVTASLEEENRKLLEAMSSMKQEYALRADAWEAKTVILDSQIQELRSQVVRLTERESQHSFSHGIAGQAVYMPEVFRQRESAHAVAKEEYPTEENRRPEAKDSSIRGRYPDLFQLHAEGKSIEQIARKIGLSKGETTLILQLAKQEEEDYV
ncbi:hypothetical protein [Gorillibacterium timonense]|uniref:hypothetical protein n=1 Tax=Gorillibacterium timonense TaxID=1689269 RepID=UPI00071C2A6C|nr:hypothetical protein [Gorillibacterium timonense]